MTIGTPNIAEAAQRLDDLLVAVELRSELRVDRPEPVRGWMLTNTGTAMPRKPTKNSADRRRPLGEEHAEVAELLEPEDVGVEAGEDEEDDEEGGDDAHGDSQSGAIDGGVARLLWTSRSRAYPAVHVGSPRRVRRSRAYPATSRES